MRLVRFKMKKLTTALLNAYEFPNIGGKNYNNETALIIACKQNLNRIAKLLIKTGESKPNVIDDNGNSALMIACDNKMGGVAIDILLTGHSNPFHVNKHKTALDLAKKNNMEPVIRLITSMNYAASRGGPRAVKHVSKYHSTLKRIEPHVHAKNIRSDIDELAYMPVESMSIIGSKYRQSRGNFRRSAILNSKRITIKKRHSI